MIGSKTGLLNTDLNTPLIIYIVVILIIVLYTGISFGLQSIKSDSADIRARGKFIIAAFLSFFIGGLLDAGLIPLNTIALIFIRIILISSAIEFYFGFFLPNWLKDRLLKQK